jgi:nicotinamide-nucleotide amidase
VRESANCVIIIPFSSNSNSAKLKQQKVLFVSLKVNMMSERLDSLVQQIAQQLVQRHLKLAVAESCTGGGLSFCLTSLAGSSAWFDRGWVTYSDSSKVELLGVKRQTIDLYGAVSEETAREMAEGILQQADVGVAITGIAGPLGGTSEKPVGTVWFAYSSTLFPTVAQVEVFLGDRKNIRLSAIEKALETLGNLLTGKQ